MMGPFDLQSDRTLLGAVKRGDEGSLARLYQRHAGFLAARLLRGGSSPAEAEEILQDTFLAVWHAPGNFRDEGTVAAWLWGIARNKQLQMFRARARVPIPAQLPEVSVAGAENAWVDGIEGRSTWWRLDRDLRQTLEAVAIRGLSVRQAATELGIPEGTVKSRLHRARLIIEEGAK